MALEHIHGKMEDNMLGSGKMGNNMEKDVTDKQMDKKGKVSGKMERGSSG